MEIIIHVNLKKLDKDYEKAACEYIKRTSPYCRIKLCYDRDLSGILTKDSSVCYAVVPGTDTLSSEELAQEIARKNLAGHSRLEFFIAENPSMLCDIRKKAKDFSISSFALSSDLTVCVLTEQLYRAYTILNNITYHK